MKNLIAVDTATEFCSVAVCNKNGEIFFESATTSQHHAEMVLKMADSVLEKAGMTKKDIEGVVFDMGPGSFTGVRVGTSTAQGWALGFNVKIAAVSSLESLAYQALQKTDSLYAVSAIDARMGEVYFAVYKKENGTLLKLGDEQVLSPDKAVEAIVSLLGTNTAVCGGTGIELLYAAGLNKNIQKHSLFPDAESIIKIGEAHFETGDVLDAAEALPLYVRNDVAWKKVSEQKKTV